MSRTGFKWNVNELLSLQREFELLQWDIDTIAQKHQRTPNAIMYRLDQEGLADYSVLYSTYYRATSATTAACEPITLEAVEEEPDVEDTKDIACLQNSVPAVEPIVELIERVDKLSRIVAKLVLHQMTNAKTVIDQQSVEMTL